MDLATHAEELIDAAGPKIGDGWKKYLKKLDEIEKKAKLGVYASSPKKCLNNCTTKLERFRNKKNF